MRVCVHVPAQLHQGPGFATDLDETTADFLRFREEHGAEFLRTASFREKEMAAGATTTTRGGEGA